MPHDEPSEEKPRVYRTEGGDLDRPDKPDIVGDDKADLSRMADDEIAKTEASTSSVHSIKGHKTAFNAVSPTYINAMYPQAQMLHQIAVAQQYYNGFWGNRIPFVSPHVASLSSPSLGSPSYGSTFSGVGVYPHSWLSALQFDAAAKAGFTYGPLVMGMGVPAQISPSFPSPMDQLHMNMAFNARMESPMFIPSPLHSPDTGAPIVTLGGKVPAPSMSALKLSMPNGGGCSSLNAGLGSSPSYVHHPANLHPNPLLSMRKILVPPVTTTVTGVAASSFATTLNGVCNESRSTSDKQTSQNDGNKRSMMMNDVGNQPGNHNGHHHQPSTSSLLRHKEVTSKKMHIKKPLNAFMLYMKEMRPTVMQEAGLKERQSAEINRILGRRWHSLTRDEQQKYYEMAKKERQEHLKKYPSWSARDNYAVHKKKKRKRDKAQDNLEAKKCRARFGLDQQAKWCKHCRRKKKCLWFKDGDGDSVDAADASPAAQVTSTSQFSSEDDFQQGPNSDKIQFKDGDVNSPHSLVTSTTMHRVARPQVTDGDEVEMDVTKNDEGSETESEDHDMNFSDDDEIEPISASLVVDHLGVEAVIPSDLVAKVDDLKAEIIKT